MLNSNHIITVLLVLLTMQGSAQTAFYANEWIDHSKQYFKVEVSQTKIHRIPYNTLVAAFGTQLVSIQGQDFALYRDGAKVPIYVSTNSIFSSSDFIEFYGQINNAEFDERLFSDPEHQINTRVSLFDRNGDYFLTVDLSGNNPIITSQNNNLTGAPTAETHFTHLIQYEFPEEVSFGAPSYLGSDPLYDSHFEDGEGLYRTPFNKGDPENITINTPYVYTQTSQQAEINPTVVSISNTNHNLAFKFNGSTVLIDSFDNYQVNHHNFNFSPLALSAANTFEIIANGSASVDRNSVSRIEVKYPRQFNFDNLSAFEFEVSGVNAKRINVSNFNDKGTQPILFDINNRRRIVGTAGGPYHFHLNYASSVPDRFLVLSSQHSDEIKTVGSLEAVNFIDFTSSKNQGTFLIITNSALFDDGSGNNFVEAYRQYRSSIAGGSYTAIVVDVETLYDQFAYGNYRHPLAIKHFIDYAFDFWSIDPEHMFLIGKGRTWNEIYTSAQAQGQVLMPTYGQPGSDVLLTAATGEYEPRISTGRLSVNNGGEIESYLEKVQLYESIQSTPLSVETAYDEKLWMKHVLHLGGGTSESEQGQYQGYLDNYKRIIEDTLFGGHVTSFFKTSTAPIQIAQSENLHNLINEGISLLTFYGHSSPQSFDFNLDSPENYTNYDRFPFICSNGCFTGNIWNFEDGISERFVKVDGRGGNCFHVNH